MSGSRNIVGLLPALLLLLLAGCGKADAGPVVAVLDEIVEGKVSKRAMGSESWVQLAKGAKLRKGDSMRTEASGVAFLLFGGQRLRVNPDTTISFGDTVEFEGEIEVGEGASTLGIHFGEAQLTNTGSMRISQREQRLQFEVLSGDALIIRRDEKTKLDVGDQLGFAFDEATLEVIRSDAPKKKRAKVEVAEGERAQLSASVSGSGARTRQAGGKWKSMPAGQHSVEGAEELDIKAKTSVTLSRGTDTVSLDGASRALLDADARAFVTLKKGRASVHAEGDDVSFAVPGGAVVLHAGGAMPTTAEVTVERRDTLVVVTTGSATIQLGDKQETLQIGESARLRKGQILVLNRTPTDSHVTLKAEADINLHVVSTPVHLRLVFTQYCPEGVVEIGRDSKQRASGTGSAIVSLSSGINRYRVLCIEGGAVAAEPAFEGRISVVKDSGSRPLPTRVPKSTIDADGRRYTVLFQNRLPEITMRWRQPPVATKFTLAMKSKRGKKKETSARKPQQTFRPGTFREGDYEFWFTAAGKESKHSHLKVEFDIASAIGYISSPRANETITGATVRLKGAAASGWAVGVGDRQLVLDGYHRFDEVVPVGEDGVAVKFSHRRYGAHYYVRSR